MRRSSLHRRLCAALALCLFGTSSAHAAMQARPVEWKVGNDAFSGFLVYDDTNAIKRPGVVMVPDCYGKGVRPAKDEDARAQTKKLYDDRKLLRERANKALDVLKTAKDVPLDAAKLGAIGYCFGGATALEMARSGADLDAVATFHGGLGTSMPAQPGTVKAAVLVLNGADDQGTKGDIPAFEDEMRKAGVDWQFVNFGGAVHCFALPEAKKPPGCVYNELAARRSERMMRVFFAEQFAD